MIYKLATAASALGVMGNASISLWQYFHGDVLRGLYWLAAANLSMMMTLNFIKLIDNIKAIHPMGVSIKKMPSFTPMDYEKEMELIKQEIADHKDIAYKNQEKS